MSILSTQYPNGPFGDPALYVWESGNRSALLFDCGDLSRFSTRQLLRVNYLFLSHCHMDHLFGFDLLLRVHMGEDKTIFIFGPPETSAHIAGKLQGYTWNLTEDQSLAFVVTDLDVKQRQKITTWYRARNRFAASESTTESWDFNDPILETRSYAIRTAMLDHRTPSLAYSLSQRPHFKVDREAMERLHLEPGDWIDGLKQKALKGERDELVDQLLVPAHSYKLSYVTDGDASAENRKAILNLIRGSDLLYHETCFLKRDEKAAKQTKHFTADFVGQVANEAQVRRISPFHFSKRYVGQAEDVLHEVSEYFSGEIIPVSQAELKPRF